MQCTVRGTREVKAQNSGIVGRDPAAVDYATRIIHQVCCFAGSFDLIEAFRDQDLSAAIERHDSAALFDRLMYDFSFQGISDEIAINYMRRHGRASWRSVRNQLAKRPNCPKLQTYWHFHDCRYEKTSRTCAEPDHILACPLPSHRLRNGHLNQMAYGLYLFIRDVAENDLIGWIDDRLGPANEEVDLDPVAKARRDLRRLPPNYRGNCYCGSFLSIAASLKTRTSFFICDLTASKISLCTFLATAATAGDSPSITDVVCSPAASSISFAIRPRFRSPLSRAT
jgi:hypothetical protein